MTECTRCHGHGFYGGKLSGDYAGPWKWCDCLAAKERMDTEPGLIGTANMARDKLLALRARATKQAPRTLVCAANRIVNAEPLVGDGYNGDF